MYTKGEWIYNRFIFQNRLLDNSKTSHHYLFAIAMRTAEQSTCTYLRIRNMSTLRSFEAMANRFRGGLLWYGGVSLHGYGPAACAQASGQAAVGGWWCLDTRRGCMKLRVLYWVSLCKGVQWPRSHGSYLSRFE